MDSKAFNITYVVTTVLDGKTLILEHTAVVEDAAEIALNFQSHGWEGVRCRRIRFDSFESYEAFVDRAERHMERVADWLSDAPIED